MRGSNKVVREAMQKEIVRHYMAEIGSKGGKKAAEKLTKAQKVERARKAVAAREAKKRS